MHLEFMKISLCFDYQIRSYYELYYILYSYYELYKQQQFPIIICITLIIHNIYIIHYQNKIIFFHLFIYLISIIDFSHSHIH